MWLKHRNEIFIALPLMAEPSINDFFGSNLYIVKRLVYLLKALHSRYCFNDYSKVILHENPGYIQEERRLSVFQSRRHLEGW